MTPYVALAPYVCDWWALLSASACLPMLVMARWVPTDDARQLAQAVREELDALYPRKVSADILRLKESDLSEQLNCAEPLNFYRLAALGPLFWNRILKRLARLQGGEYIEPEVVLLLNGAARLKRPMLAMELDVNDERKRA
jgi:hypothetical protein